MSTDASAGQSPTYAQLVKERDQLLVAYRTINKRHLGNVPLPNGELRLHVGTLTTEANYLAQGAGSSTRVIQTFGTAPDGPILDWGCGSGRTWRWLQTYPAWRKFYYGCDVDAAAIDWLRSCGAKNLALTSDRPVLPYDDQFFAGLFCFSVLTHIPAEAHRQWYAELCRVLKPGAKAYLTTQGESIVEQKRVSETDAQTYRASGHAYIRHDGHYKDASLVSEAFTREALSGMFKIVQYTATGYGNMDVIIVERP